jgi:3-hydroxybutyryl-CoA dehydrogenase
MKQIGNSGAERVGVIGAGTMGRGIAQIASTAGHPVVLVDLNPDVLGAAKMSLERILNRQAEKGRMTEAQVAGILGRIAYETGMEGLADAGLVIEAVVENAGVKSKIFNMLEEIVSEQCWLATNTSSLSVTALAATCKHPERFLGLHFFNPAPMMPLVEVIPALQSLDGLASSAFDLMSAWGKKPAMAGDTPGFIVNRVARPFYGEAIRIMEEGVADHVTIDWAMTALGGFRMGPFTLMDLIGNDINYAVTETVWTAFHHDPRYRPSFSQKRNVDAGYLGKKSGRGWYDYSDGAAQKKPREDKDLGQDILWRILVMLINEAADALFWNVADAVGIDLAMQGGVNYPKGLLAWADQVGVDRCVAKLDELYTLYGEDRYRCSPKLRQMAQQQLRFRPDLLKT